jgi:phytoene dehydrogenase-like protein
VLSCFRASTAPYKLAKGPGTISAKRLADNVMNAERIHAELKKIIIGRQVLTPLDMEREFGLTQGNIFQGELSLEQLFFLRPVRAGRITDAR